MQQLERLREKVQNAMQQLSWQKQPKELYSPISYTLQSDGKRIRPLLTLLACNMFSEKIDDAIAPALGMEVFHNFTLLHDDIMDKAPVRRGMPTVHEKWNANTAILSGDAMMIEAYKLVSKTPHTILPKVLDVFSETALGVCEGQMFDMQFEKRMDVSEEEYLEMIRLKTSVLLAAALKIGALIGGASEKDANELYSFGISVGLAFQLIDDWLDSFGEEAVFGKRIGGDILENKKTYLLIKALELANPEQKKELFRWIEAVDFAAEEKIASVKEIFQTLGVDKQTQIKAENFSQDAFSHLAKLNIPNEKKQGLEILVRDLLKRDK
ncbi:MAG: isoprenyl synthetase [Bacteroidetes bacterium HGW-Bacteroidetes-4]|jgi:geranylgeranyl diphosphate synthase type II|nr:MAG: isoprenyl synthetase [Bacteroidetes bacterium HGW-Bacteroidetes-4]